MDSFICKAYKSRFISQKEVIEDKIRLKRLNKYVNSLDTMERRTLLLNQLIIVFNSFKIGWACVMLEISAETPSNLSKFYAIMFELGFDIAGVDIDEKFLSIFRNILNENEHQSKILRSFQNQRRCEWW